MKPWKKSIPLWVLPFLISCFAGCPESPVNPFLLDITPPTLVAQRVTGPDRITLEFSEEIFLRKTPRWITPLLPYKEEIHSVNPEDMDMQITVSSYETIGKEICISLSTPMKPGKLYHLESIVYDTKHNSLTLLIPIYGYNGNPPELLITEFTVEGNSKTRPETVELYAKSSGNLAGVTLHISRYQEEEQYIFPNREVSQGTYILLHMRTTRNPAEEDEFLLTNESDAPNTHPNAWDFWSNNYIQPLHTSPPSEGLSASNGSLALYNSPQGSLLDAVIYSSGKSTAHQGFGSAEVLKQAATIGAQGGWAAWNSLEQYTLIAGDIAIISKGSTTTRSICRKREDTQWIDTNSRNDWYITPTGGVSFGEE